MVVLATSSAQNADVSRFVNLPLALQFSSEEGKMNLRNVVVNGWRMTSMTDWLDWLTDSLFMLCIPEETINWLFMLSIPEESYWSSFDSHHQPVTIERFSVRSAPPILSYPAYYSIQSARSSIYWVERSDENIVDDQVSPIAYSCSYDNGFVSVLCWKRNGTASQQKCMLYYYD